MDLYLHVAHKLEQRIDAEQLPPGTQLPGERALAAEYGVADKTVREALSALAARGRVVRRRRRGTYVADLAAPRERLDVGTVITRNELGYLRNRHAGHWRPIGPPSRRRVPCPHDVALLLQVEPGEEVVARSRAVGTDTAHHLTITYLPQRVVDQAPVVAEQDTGPGGYVERLELDLGLGPISWFADVVARLPLPEEAAALQMPAEQPVLVEMVTLTSDRAELPLAVDVIVRDGRSWTLGFELRRDDSATWPITPAAARNTPATPTTGRPATSWPEVTPEA
ncbi:MAG: GntR-family regulatory protein [Pseudonocardia sp.]|nr:GntR-family regulatory protein [Pseudonocardia sp.]